MSKSLGNCLYLDESKDDMWKKLSTAVTDTNRKRRSDPGDPDICNIFTMHRAFSGEKDIEHCAAECRRAGIGCLECKKILLENIFKMLEPVQARQRELRESKDYVFDVLRDGEKRAKAIAERTMQEVYTRIGIAKYHTKALIDPR
jgi:tryptophanyl-tRNA synthetase